MIDFGKALRDAAEADCLRTLPTRDTTGMVNLSTNDYLGLADDTSLWDTFMGQYSPQTRSMSASSSRLLTGNHQEYQNLENTLRETYGREALVFNCGYHVNAGVLASLTDKRDLIIADKLIHASLIDGIRLSEATFMRYNHNDLRHLRSLLTKYRKDAERCIIVTESIFSMDGDLAPLEELVEIKREFDCMIYVDEAHGVGVRGKWGEGLVGEKGLLNDVDMIVGTCGKALASEGAYIVAGKTICDYLVNKCRTMIFTTGLPPINVAWTEFIMRHIREMESERKQLLATSQWLAESLGTKAESQIVPYICGENSAAVAMSLRLQEAGFYALPIRHPTVPKGQARLRLSLKANLTREMLQPIIGLMVNGQ